MLYRRNDATRLNPRAPVHVCAVTLCFFFQLSCEILGVTYCPAHLREYLPAILYCISAYLMGLKVLHSVQLNPDLK